MLTSRRLSLIAFAIVTALALWAEVHLAIMRPFAGRLDGQEPEAHIMVSELAMDQTSWKSHHFLPIFTLGAPYNKYIDNHPGAESTDNLGNYYYVSTPPLTFDLPYLFAKLTGGTPTIARLRGYNLLLQYTSAMALAWLVFLCGKHSGRDRNLCFLAALTAATIYITAPECLHSHTITLWAQQFFCLLLVLQIIVYLFRPSWWLLGLMAFVGCLADWTPYVANFGMAAIAGYSYYKTRDRRSLKIALALLAGVLIALVVMVLWFHTEYSIASYFADLRTRHAARAEGGFSVNRFFLPRYIDSFGFFTVIGVAALALRPWKKTPNTVGREAQPILPAINPFWIVIAVFVIALIENPIMKVHALKYSYDRLKGVELLAIVVAWAALRSLRTAKAMFASCAVVGLISVGLFYIDYETPRGFSYVAHSQQELVGDIVAKTAGNAPAFFNGDFRGSEAYYAKRNMVEFEGDNGPKLLDEAKQWCLEHHVASGTVYELLSPYYTAAPNEFPRTLRIEQVYADRPAVVVADVKLNEKAGDYHPLFDGYSRHLTPILK